MNIYIRELLAEASGADRGFDVVRARTAGGIPRDGARVVFPGELAAHT